MIYINNAYHGTQARVMSRHLSSFTVRSVRAICCGAEGCDCGGPLGERSQWARAGIVEIVGNREYKLYCEGLNNDGSADLVED